MTFTCTVCGRRISAHVIGEQPKKPMTMCSSCEMKTENERKRVAEVASLRAELASLRARHRKLVESVKSRLLHLKDDDRYFEDECGSDCLRCLIDRGEFSDPVPGEGG